MWGRWRFEGARWVCLPVSRRATAFGCLTRYSSRMPGWHEDDAFWSAVAPILFRPERVAATVAEVDDVAHLVALEPGTRVLDLACGIGRHALELARRGFRVTGIDRTPAFIDEARRCATKAALPIELVCDDMRTFRRPGAFDAAICLANSFTYFDDPADDRATLANVAASLRPSGAFVLEIGWISREIVRRVLRPTSRHWDELPDGTVVLQEGTVDAASSRIENRWILLGDGRRTELRFAQRLYGASDLSALLLECGFARVDVHGSLGGAPYDRAAERLVVVART